jgi:PIN domain nuclease of toxin-antitoxin system
MKLILDTCAIIWAVGDENCLPAACRSALMAADSEIFVSPISVAEIACAVERGRLTLDRHWKRWFRHFVEMNGWKIIPVDLDIIEEAFSLPGKFHSDPADRIIVATARRHNLVAVTADKKILAYPHVNVLWESKE